MRWAALGRMGRNTQGLAQEVTALILRRAPAWGGEQAGLLGSQGESRVCPQSPSRVPPAVVQMCTEAEAGEGLPWAAFAASLLGHGHPVCPALPRCPAAVPAAQCPRPCTDCCLLVLHPLCGPVYRFLVRWLPRQRQQLRPKRSAELCRGGPQPGASFWPEHSTEMKKGSSPGASRPPAGMGRAQILQRTLAFRWPPAGKTTFLGRGGDPRPKPLERGLGPGDWIQSP